MLGTGAIELHRADGTLVESFDASTGAHLTASGSTLTINPSADLSGSPGYYLTILRQRSWTRQETRALG